MFKYFSSTIYGNKGAYCAILGLLNNGLIVTCYQCNDSFYLLTVICRKSWSDCDSWYHYTLQLARQSLRLFNQMEILSWFSFFQHWFECGINGDKTVSIGGACGRVVKALDLYKGNTYSQETKFNGEGAGHASWRLLDEIISLVFFLIHLQYINLL